MQRAEIQDVALAAFFAAVAQLDVWVLGTVPGPRALNAAIVAFVAPPLAWRRTRPCAALTVTSLAIAAQVLVVPGKPPSGFLYAGPMLIGAYSVGAYAPWSWRAFAALGAIVVTLCGVYAPALGLPGAFSQLSGDLMWLVLPLVAWWLGRRFAARRREHAALRAAREREQERLAALEHERGRMARELHDVLAHSVSLMGVQAGAAERILARDPERTRPVLQSIQQTSRDSVAELRRLLGMLRADEAGPELAPQ